MKPRGSFDPSDYSWGWVAEAAAYLLMDEGAGNRPFSIKEIAAHLEKEHSLGADARRAALHIEGRDDPKRGWELLAEKAVRAMVAAKVARRHDEHVVWIGNGRTEYTSFGRRIPLRTKAERAKSESFARVEHLGAGRPFEGLPKRAYKLERMNKGERERYDELLENIRTFGYDRNFPILVNEEGGIVAGRTRKMVCDELGLDWRDYVVRVERSSPLSAPLRNVDDLMRAARDNIGRGVSKAERDALEELLLAAGVTQAEVAATLGTSQASVSERAKARRVINPDTATPDRAKVDDETITAALELLVREQPKIGVRSATAVLRDRYDWRFSDVRVQGLIKVARSRVAGEPHPDPEPEPPVHRHIWITVCSECGEQHP